jgi:Protein of unknown function (DUF2384)
MTSVGNDPQMWADAVGPFYDTAGVATVLGVSGSAVRGRRARGSLLSMQTGSGSTVYPTWQFQDGHVVPGLGRVLRSLRGVDVSRWTLAAWLRTPDVELGGRTPMDCLRAGDQDPVLLVASRASEHWVQ